MDKIVWVAARDHEACCEANEVDGAYHLKSLGRWLLDILRGRRCLVRRGRAAGVELSVGKRTGLPRRTKDMLEKRR